MWLRNGCRSDDESANEYAPCSPTQEEIDSNNGWQVVK